MQISLVIVEHILISEHVLFNNYGNPMGRIKKCRTIELDIPGMKCHCMAPVGLDCDQLEQLDKVMLEPDELQSLVYQDLDGLTMDQACAKMGVSKTVYAGIYASARRKVTQALIDGSVLRICHKSEEN